jgi:hypothetical protein
VSNAGQLSVFSVQGDGVWNGPTAIGPAQFAPTGGALVAGPQFGCPSQTNVWLGDNTGRLVVFWVENAGTWNGPVPISAAGFTRPGSPVITSQQFGLSNQTDLFCVNNAGLTTVSFVDRPGQWLGPQLL